MCPVCQKQKRALSSLETDTRVGGLQRQGAAEGWTVTVPSCAVPQLQPSLPSAELLAGTLQTTPTHHHLCHWLPVRSCQQSTQGAERAGLGEAYPRAVLALLLRAVALLELRLIPASSSLGLSQNQPTEPSQRRPEAAERQPCSGDAPGPWDLAHSSEESCWLTPAFQHIPFRVTTGNPLGSLQPPMVPNQCRHDLSSLRTPHVLCAPGRASGSECGEPNGPTDRPYQAPKTLQLGVTGTPDGGNLL